MPTVATPTAKLAITTVIDRLRALRRRSGLRISRLKLYHLRRLRLRPQRDPLPPLFATPGAVEEPIR